MLILLLVIGICMIIVAHAIDREYGYEDTATGLYVSGWILTGVVIMVMFSNIIIVSKGSTFADKIEMYQTENESIQTEISTIAATYMGFEKDLYKELKAESPITLATVFPELKSSEIVMRQMEVYLENNKAIKKLREAQIDVRVSKWWLYFGQ